MVVQKTYTQAYSLFELLVVLAILAILMVAAQPLYNKITFKAKMLRLLSAAEGAKLAVAEDLLLHNSIAKKELPGDNDLVDKIIISSDDAGDIASIDIFSSKKFFGKQKDAKVTLLAKVQNDFIEWSCDASAELKPYLPNSCNKSARG